MICGQIIHKDVACLVRKLKSFKHVDQSLTICHYVKNCFQDLMFEILDL